MFIRTVTILLFIGISATAQAQLYPQRMVNIPQQPRVVTQQRTVSNMPFQVKLPAQYGHAFSVPAVKKKNAAAETTDDVFIYQPVPAPTPSRTTFIANQPNVATQAATVQTTENLTKDQTQKDDRGFSGSIEGGINYSTGNNESRSANLAAEVAFDTYGWKHILTGRLINSEENNLQTEEEYRAGLESRYKLSDVDYVFGEVDAVKDRFSGYDYRITEILGYGRHWYDDESFKWSSAVGGGFQHAKSITGDKSDDPLGRFRNELFWQMFERLSFENTLEIDVSNFTTVFSSSAFKNNLTEDLFLKLGMDNEYISDVPAGVNELDTDIYLNVAYEY